MKKNKIFMCSTITEIAEHETYLQLKSRMCYYDDCNLNGTMLPYSGREEQAETAAQTLVNMPVQAKYKKINGKDDLGSHECKENQDTGEIEFCTDSVGVNTKAWIEKCEVRTVNGENKVLPCLFSEKRIWKRYSNTVNAIKRLFETYGSINSSWEISASEYEYKEGTKILTNYEFLSDCLLGSNVVPAYQGTSKVISLSEAKEQELLVAEALSQDIASKSIDIKTKEKEEEILKNPEELKKEEKSVEEKTDKKLTSQDLMVKIREAIEEKLGYEFWIMFHFPIDCEIWVSLCSKKSELDCIKFNYTVEDGKVEISEPQYVTLSVSPREINSKIESLNNEISTANGTIAELKGQIAELVPYKSKVEEAERERREKEFAENKENLISNVTASGFITREEISNSTELSAYVEALDEKSLKAIVADRYIESLKNTKKIETSEKEKSKCSRSVCNLSDLEDGTLNVRTIMKEYCLK